MAKRSLKSIVLGGMAVAIAATSAAANPFTIDTQRLSQVPQRFTCAPHLLTFVVKPLDQRQGTGIRCIKLSEGRPGTPIPKLAWYGEGNWGGATYRHVGHAFYRGANLVGFASDIHGNGEDINNNFPGNLSVQLVSGSWANPTQIAVKGAWNEVWVRANAVNYTPLSRPKTCGSYFDQYRVSDLTGSRSGEGLRCMLRVGIRNTTWFGNGDWGGSTYSHMGTRSFNGYGASDISAAPFGPISNTFGWGSLKFTSVAPSGFNVTGAWSEKWR